MSLKEFHLVFVSAAILCSFILGYWAVRQYAGGPNVGYGATALGAFSVALALIVYEVVFARKIKG